MRTIYYPNLNRSASSKVKCVRVRKIAIDIEMKDDDCGCD
jgi:hypothetical protein